MKFIISCFMLLTSVSVLSQKQTSLSNREYIELQNKVRKLASSNIDSAFVLTEKIQNSDNYTHKAFATGTKSYLYKIKGDSIRSKQCYVLAFGYLKKIMPGDEKKKLQAYLLNYGGLIDWKSNNFSNALDKYKEGKKLSEEAHDFIQIIKFNSNIALINSEVGNHTLAIHTSKEANKLIDKIEFLYSKEEFIRSKSNINFYLGTFYEEYYEDNKSEKKLLDSAEYYYKKALNYSKDHLYNRINAKINLGNIYYQKNDLLNARAIYQDVLYITKGDANLQKEYYNTIYNLGDLNFTLKNFTQSLVYFQKVDSMYEIHKRGRQQFINSSYYQSKIYNEFKDADKAVQYSKIYIDNFEKSETKINEEKFKVNIKLNETKVKNEMVALQNKYRYRVFYRYCYIALSVLLVAVGLFKKHTIDQKKIDNKVNALIEKYKSDQRQIELMPSETANSFKEEIKEKKEGISLTLDEEKEREIIEKLKSLERKEEYLKTDFTQQLVAKKIKTNTTYLSYIVNKRFGKTFSEYSNELKINYVINELISNTTYRKYSTQAIAESVGFKNAISFTKSFSKRTGVTPVQFVKRLENND